MSLESDSGTRISKTLSLSLLVVMTELTSNGKRPHSRIEINNYKYFVKLINCSKNHSRRAALLAVKTPDRGHGGIIVISDALRRPEEDLQSLRRY
jgi:hypothetical protein